MKVVSVLVIFIILFNGSLTGFEKFYDYQNIDYKAKQTIYTADNGKTIAVTGIVNSLDFSKEYPNMEKLIFRNIVNEYVSFGYMWYKNSEYKSLADLQILFQESKDDLGLSKNPKLKTIIIAMEGVTPLLMKTHLPNVENLEISFYGNNTEPLLHKDILTNMPGLLSIKMTVWPSTEFLQEAAKLPNLTHMKFVQEFEQVTYNPSQEDISLYQSMPNLTQLYFFFTYYEVGYYAQENSKQSKIFDDMRHYLQNVTIDIDIYWKNVGHD